MKDAQIVFKVTGDRPDAEEKILNHRGYQASQGKREWLLLISVVKDPTGGEAMLTANQYERVIGNRRWPGPSVIAPKCHPLLWCLESNERHISWRRLLISSRETCPSRPPVSSAKLRCGQPEMGRTLRKLRRVEKHRRCRHEAAAQHTVEFDNARGAARRRLGTAGEADEFHALPGGRLSRRSRAHRNGLLDDAVPLAAAFAASGPFRADRTAALADETGGRLGHVSLDEMSSRRQLICRSLDSRHKVKDGTSAR